MWVDGKFINRLVSIFNESLPLYRKMSLRSNFVWAKFNVCNLNASRFNRRQVDEYFRYYEG